MEYVVQHLTSFFKKFNAPWIRLISEGVAPEEFG